MWCAFSVQCSSLMLVSWYTANAEMCGGLVAGVQDVKKVHSKSTLFLKLVEDRCLSPSLQCSADLMKSLAFSFFSLAQNRVVGTSNSKMKKKNINEFQFSSI